MQRLKELRKHQGLTQTECAAMLGVEPQSYSRYELGQSEPPLASVVKLANHYRVTVDYLIGNSDVPTAYTPPPASREELIDLVRAIIREELAKEVRQ